MYQGKISSVKPFITIYSLAHFIVDAASTFLFYLLLEFTGNVILFMLVYNGIAFVLQAPLGYLIDKIFHPKPAAIVGLLLIAMSFLFWGNIYAGLAVVSTGNALFHVSGGSLVLSLSKKKATFSAIYVAPGGIGLALGTFLFFSKINIFLLLFPAILLVLSFVIYFIKTPDFKHDSEIKRIPNYTLIIIGLILIPIAVRSLIGLSIEFPWKENQYFYLSLIAALAMGKVIGGVLADRFGLMRIGVGGLLISIPLLALFAPVPLFGILGAFVFSFTMPVTLLAILNVMPQNKGLSFGLSTVALFVGSLPIILEETWLKNNFTIAVFILLATLTLFVALHIMGKLKLLNRNQ